MTIPEFYNSKAGNGDMPKKKKSSKKCNYMESSTISGLRHPPAVLEGLSSGYEAGIESK